MDIIGAAALIFGRIQTDKYDENSSKGKGWRDKEGVYHQYYYRKGVYNLSLNIKVVDMETSKILAVKTLSASYKDSKSADKTTPAQIDKNALYTYCLENIKNQFMRLVAPYKVAIKAKFQTDKQLPEVDQAITQFKIGEWDDGMALLKKATQKQGLESKIMAKAYYDLGLAQSYRGEHDDALVNLKEAMKLMLDKSIYQDAIVQAKAERKKAEKLKEQI